MTVILFSLLFTGAVHAADGAQPPTPWYDLVRRFYDETQAEETMEQLRQDPKLPDQVCQAIKTGNREAEGLEAVTRLEIQKCWPEVFELVKTQSVWMAVLAAESLNRTTPRVEWKNWLKNSTAPDEWAALEPEAKLAILPCLNEQKILVSAKDIQNILNDDEGDVRKAALPVLEMAILKDAKNASLQKLFKKSLTKKPYQFRLIAYFALTRFPTDLKRTYKSSIDNCAQHETQNRVKDVCLKLQKSL